MCFHDRLREFTFTDKQVVKMCLDCPTYENARRPVFCPPLPTKLFSDTDMLQRWDVILDDAGLNTEMGTPDWLMFDSDIVALQPHRQSTRKVYDMVDDHDWALRQKPFAHSLSMPRSFMNYCPSCGLYVNQLHECECDTPQWAARADVRQREEKRVAHDATVVLSDPSKLTPSLILERQGGYAK